MPWKNWECIGLANFPTRIAVLYAIFSVLWIAGSDGAVAFLFPDHLSLAQTFKGWAFVAVTTLLLFFLLRREMLRRSKV